MVDEPLRSALGGSHDRTMTGQKGHRAATISERNDLASAIAGLVAGQFVSSLERNFSSHKVRENPGRGSSEFGPRALNREANIINLCRNDMAEKAAWLSKSPTIADPNSLASRMRGKRNQQFREAISQLPRPLSILDVGGTQAVWKAIDFVDRPRYTDNVY